MSPEQIEKPKQIDHRSDVYAMGIILYEMLVGKVPFDGDTDFEIYNKHIRETPPPLRSVVSDISPMLENIVLKALEKDPNNRFVGCGQFLEYIEHYEKEESVVKDVQEQIEIKQKDFRTDEEKAERIFQQKTEPEEEEKAERINLTSARKCKTCGSLFGREYKFCPACGLQHGKPINKSVLLFLTFFFGGFGAHKFYVKKYWQGLFYLLFCFTYVPAIIALVEFVIYASTSAEKLQEEYPETKSVPVVILLVAIGFIGILTAIAIPNFVAYNMRAYNSSANADIKNAYTAAQVYYTVYPSDVITSRHYRK